MREIAVYDDRRRPVWHRALAPGECALFHVDAATGHHRTPEGRRIRDHWTRTCLVFGSMADAERYAVEAVRREPAVACRLFAAEGDGAAADRVVDAGSAATPADWRRALRRLVWGATLIALGIAGVWIDWIFDWFYLIGVLVGVKFLTVGVVRFIEGFVALRRVRAQTALASRATTRGAV